MNHTGFFYIQTELFFSSLGKKMNNLKIVMHLLTKKNKNFTGNLTYDRLFTIFFYLFPCLLLITVDLFGSYILNFVFLNFCSENCSSNFTVSTKIILRIKLS